MLTLRAARADDEAQLLSWRNEPATRRFSFDTRLIDEDEHGRWFKAKLSDPTSVILIAEDDDVPVGQVRLDSVEQDRAEVSISVAPAVRGRGMATEALRLAILQAPELLGVRRLYARIKPENEASLRLFRAVGFEVIAEHADVIEFERAVPG